MKYVKMLGLLALAAAATMAFASSASAGIFNIEKNGPAWTGEIHATAGEITLHGAAATITCASSTISGTVTQHGAGVTGKGNVTSLLFNGCGFPVHVKKTGTLEFHTHPGDSGGTTYGLLTSSGAEIEMTVGGGSCIYTTNNTEIGTVTNSTHQEVTGAAKTALIHVDSEIPRTGGSLGFFCGASGELTATYTITTPDYLDYI